LHARALGGVELRLDRGDDTCRDLVLESKEVGQRSLVALHPDFVSRSGIGQLDADPHAFARPSDAAFKDVAHAKLATDLLHADGPALVREGRTPSDDEEAAQASQCGCDLLGNSVCEVLLVRIPTQVLEWQNSN
jgi:hypothetical protein